MTVEKKSKLERILFWIIRNIPFLFILAYFLLCEVAIAIEMLDIYAVEILYYSNKGVFGPDLRNETRLHFVKTGFLRSTPVFVLFLYLKDFLKPSKFISFPVTFIMGLILFLNLLYIALNG